MHTSKQLSVAEKTKKEILNLLYDQTNRIAIAHPLSAGLVSLWFYNSVALSSLLIWIGAISLVTFSRVLLNKAYKKYYQQENAHLWLHAWAGMSAVTACIYSVGFIYFTPIEQSHYVVLVGMFVIALSASSVIAYGASIYGILSFFIPVTLPSSIYFLLSGSEIGLIMSLSLVFYAVVIISLLKNVNDAFKKSIQLNFHNQKEIEKRKLIEKQLQDISRRDGLTGLFNRRYFDEVLDIEIGRAHRNHQPLCLIMFDVDYFKDYNDHYGHVAGDNCLIAVAEIVEKLANRKGDLFARYGGEEFAIILPNIDIKGAIAFANKIQKRVQNKNIPHESSKLTSLKRVTVSVGVTNLMPFKKVRAKELIEDADAALYKAKKQGRNRVHYLENNGLGQDLS